MWTQNQSEDIFGRKLYLAGKGIATVSDFKFSGSHFPRCRYVGFMGSC